MTMNTKEIGEIRRRLRRERSNITAIYGCYVNDNKEMITHFRQSTGMMPENEADKYYRFLRRALSILPSRPPRLRTVLSISC